MLCEVGRAGAAVRTDRPVARLDVCARSRASREARRASDRQRCLQGTKAAHQSAERCASDQPSAPWMASAVPLLACSLRWSSRTSVVDAIRHKPIRESSSAGSNRRTRCILASNDVVGMLSVIKHSVRSGSPHHEPKAPTAKDSGNSLEPISKLPTAVDPI
jgi:hypothetical protein